MHGVHDLRRVDLNLLVVLDALLTERNVSRAAERLAMTQPAVSHALARLRDLLNDPLLVRVGNEMRVSARGNALRIPLAEALARVRDMVLPSRFDPANCQRTFRLSLSDYGCDVVLSRLLPDLRQQAPGIDLVIGKAGRLETLRQVSEGELDGATGVFAMIPEDIKCDTLFQEDFVVITDRKNLGPDDSLSLDQYLAAPHMHVSAEGLHHSHVDHALAGRGLRRRLAMVIPYWVVAVELLKNTDLLLTVASRTVQPACLPPSLAIVQPPFPIAPFDFVYIWRADTESDPEAMWLRSQICAAAQTCSIGS